MKNLHVWFPGFETEAHRQSWRGAQLVSALADLGVCCHLKMSRQCQVVFVASFSTSHDAAHGYRMDPFNRPVVGYKHFPDVPVVHYCWDLYPFKVEDRDDPEHWRWQAYLDELRSAREVWVPSACTVERIRQYTGRDALVVKTSVPLWDLPAGAVPRSGDHVVDVLRKYPGDPNADLCRAACGELGIPCVELGDHGRSWDEYRRVVSTAKVLVSAACEASTGGLSLLEGHRHGVPCLLSDSPRHGGRDYFGGWATYFDHLSKDDFKAKLLSLYKPGRGAVACNEHWVDIQHSEQAFARRIAERLMRVVG